MARGVPLHGGGDSPRPHPTSRRPSRRSLQQGGLMCESLGAEVVAVDGIVSDGLKYVRNHFAPKFEFYSIDIMSSSFFELGRYDIILYLGLLYHTIYPFEQLLRIAGLCNP